MKRLGGGMGNEEERENGERKNRQRKKKKLPRWRKGRLREEKKWVFLEKEKDEERENGGKKYENVVFEFFLDRKDVTL